MQLKQRLLEKCLGMVRERIANAEASLKASHESMIGETKSSAGDKFETARAMLQGEQDRMKAVVIKNKELEYILSQVSKENHDVAQSGSLVCTDTLTYYISVGLGKVILDNKNYYAVSLASPIGQLLNGKKPGDRITINSNEIIIQDVL